MLKIILLFLGNIICNTAGNLLMKFGMRRTDGINLATAGGILHGLILNPALVIGAFSYVASLGFYIFVLKNIKLNIAYPVSVGSAMIVVSILSSAILKESIARTQIVGSIVILLGILILTR